MKYVSVSVLTVVAAVAALLAGTVRAQEGAGSGEPMPPFGMNAAPAPVAKPAAPRAGLFAPSSAVNARHLTPEQREEWRFLKEAAAASRFDIDAARMAISKSGDAGVRSLASALIDHNASAGPALQRMLHMRGMAAPMLANDQRKALNRLAKLNGKKFDREFLETVGLRFQPYEVRLYERAALATHDPALRAWIDKTLAGVRTQLAAAERAAGRDVRMAKGAMSPTQFMGAGPSRGAGSGLRQTVGAPASPAAASPTSLNTR